jgi:hypothetical protein
MHLMRKDDRHKTCQLFVPLLSLALLCCPPSLNAGNYTDSAHGAADVGVYRSNIGDAPPQGFGYSRGNCAHCHEQHASFVGSEPGPAVDGPADFALFADNFSGIQSGSYVESDGFCFYCHNNNASAQQVLNNDYSQTFGCGGQGTTSILPTMNQLSGHNLYDIVNNFGDGTFPWFTSVSNPCDFCHNPHLAKRNKATPTDPTFSAISKPSSHFTLWGTTQTMESSYNTGYEPPFCSSSLADREPAGSVDAATGRANTPNYVSFCTDCHNSTNQIYSTTLGGNVTEIDWVTGDHHGQITARADVQLNEPYATEGTGNFVLSCMDCHEPHGAPNLMLLRRRVNGSDLSSNITDTDHALTAQNSEWGLLCSKCHPDDIEAGVIGASPNHWQHVHHLAPDAPFPSPTMCISCHLAGPTQPPISCGTTDPLAGNTEGLQCHGHGKSF